MQGHEGAARGDDLFPVGTTGRGLRQISPTDVAQYIRLEQCARYLRLRLHERSANPRFMADYGVVPQAIPPLLTRSGARFEQRVEAGARRRYDVLNLATEVAHERPRDDNERVIAEARNLAPGGVRILFQPRLRVAVEGWLIRGDVDVLRLARDAEGALHALIIDMKSSTAARVEHRLQVALYHEMLDALFGERGIEAEIGTGILYRGPSEAPPDAHGPSLARDAARREEERARARDLLSVDTGFLELVVDGDDYRAAVRDLVTGPRSSAARVIEAPFDDLPYHLGYKCDGCLYNEFCMKWSAERDDLSLLPHLTAQDKNTLWREGIHTTRALAMLKEPARVPDAGQAWDGELIAAPGREAEVRALAAIQPTGARLDELIQRARRYRKWRGDAVESLSYIPSKGYGSLPYSAPDHNPNLVRVYIDAQHDYLHDRIYMLGALVAGCQNGEEDAARRRSIVHITPGPPADPAAEERLFVGWVEAVVRAIVEAAAPDAEGRPRAPIHLIFYNSFEQRLLLEGLGRHAGTVLGATGLYDFVTQLAAFDSPVVTFLDHEIREHKNYPMVCQSLQAVAAYLRFDWNAPAPYRDVFRTRLFDFWGKLDDAGDGRSPWYTNRARFNSQIPLEYAYAAWDDLATIGDVPASYRRATMDLLTGFHARRLEAMEHVARDLPQNRQTEKRPFDLPDLSAFEDRARTLARALDEFVTIERHVALGDWKRTRLAPPERRVLSGDTLIARYVEADQPPDVRERNRDNKRRQRLRREYEQAYRAAHPGAKRVQLSAEQRAACAWSQEGLRLRLRLECDGVDCDLDEALALSSLRDGDRVVINPRTTVDSRLPAAEQTPFTPTPRQMLYGTRATLSRIVATGRDADGRAIAGYVELEMAGASGGDARGFAFGAFTEPLDDGAVYTLDEDPNDWYGSFCAKVVEGLCAGERDTLYERLVDPAAARVCWPDEAAAGQARFLAGLDALHEAGALGRFEPSKRAYIGVCGDAPVLLVQGPPGTGKSYATAFALLARLQGAMAAGRDYRAFVSCKTHAATDVLLDKVLAARELLRNVRREHPALFATYFDARLLDAPLFRVRPRGAAPEGIIALPKDGERPAGTPTAVERIGAARWCVVATPPAGIRGLIKDTWPKELFGHDLCDALLLDEASQLNLPEAMMAALPLKPDGHLIVVGDHRQMPPIVHHDWLREPRRTFKEYRSYESLFQTLLPLVALTGSAGFQPASSASSTLASSGHAGPQPVAGWKPAALGCRFPQEPRAQLARIPGDTDRLEAGAPSDGHVTGGATATVALIQFEESFRLHEDMAAFLGREVYVRDGINYHSRRRDVLPAHTHADPLVAAVLSPQHPLVVVVHDEDRSQMRNPFEQELVAPILAALADAAAYRFGPDRDLGVVVPHRAQRAALQAAVPALTVRDPATGMVLRSAVDTVERFQGDERTVILVSATESDPDYLLTTGDFLLDPRRLTVALSRATSKMILVASRSVFSLFSADEETFAHAQLWKNLLRHTCTVPLWSGPRGAEGIHVEVWGNLPAVGLRP